MEKKAIELAFEALEKKKAPAKIATEIECLWMALDGNEIRIS